MPHQAVFLVLRLDEVEFPVKLDSQLLTRISGSTPGSAIAQFMLL
jgi:hypothetical protein